MNKFIIAFFFLFLSLLSPTELMAYTKYSPCQVEWGSPDGSPQPIVEVLKRYAAKTKQAFMSKLPIKNMTLTMGSPRPYRCDDAFDDLEGRLASQHGIYLDAHSGIIILFENKGQANIEDGHWTWEWEKGVTKMESEMKTSCFSSGGIKMNNAVLDHKSYLDVVNKKLKKKLVWPDGSILNIPLTVLMTKSVCKEAVWNGYVTGLNINGYRVVKEGAGYRVVR